MSSFSREDTGLLSPRVNCDLSRRMLSYLPRDMCLPSKAALVILVWTLVVGAVYAMAFSESIVLAVLIRKDHHHHVFEAITLPYAILAFMLLCYPLSGLLADVCCGRYRAVMISVCLVCSSLPFAAFAIVTYSKYPELSYVIAGFSCVLFIAGISGYQANFIQFGLDQLMDAPSRYSGLFIHWVMWCDALGNGIVLIFFSAFAGCQAGIRHGLTSYYAGCSLFPVFFVLLIAVIVFSCYKRRWFHSEPGYQNPYKMVCKVLHFARKHKSPIYRSALTYYDDRKPSRIDFAKEKYGGPFTSEQVEDVKSFLRILTVLISISPVYVLEVPTSYFVFPLFSLHTTDTSGIASCTVEWILFQSGTMKYFSGVANFTIYIWLVYTVLPRCYRPVKILQRIIFGIIVYLLGVTSMLLIDVTGHVQLQEKDVNSSLCMFGLETITDNSTVDISFSGTLDLPWPVLIIPNILVGIGQPVLIGTVLEFISAQSPHSMKGLIVGVFFASRGCVQLLSTFSILPFSNNWDGSVAHLSALASCGFGYFLFTIVVALTGLILFSVVAKRYKYRQRGEEPYGPHIVEEIVSDNLDREVPHLQASVTSYSSNSNCLNHIIN